MTHLITIASDKGGVGKTVTALHLASELAQRYGEGSTLLIDADENHGATMWAERCTDIGFPALALHKGLKQLSSYDWVVMDTPGGPESSALKDLAEGADLLILPTAPERLSLDATLSTAAKLDNWKLDHYKILLTLVPPTRKVGDEARMALSEYPLFASQIRQYAAYQKATGMGCLVANSKDSKGRIAAGDYRKVADEVVKYFEGTE